MKTPSRARRAAVLIASVAVGVGAALAVPTAANAATTTYTLDCGDIASLGYSYQTFYVAPGNTVTFELTGFDELYDTNSSTVIGPLNPLGDTVEIAAGDEWQFYDTTLGCADFFDASVEEAAPETVPTGSKLYTQAISITTPAPQITVVENDGGFGEHQLAGISTCGLSTDYGGQHVYGTLDITVTTAGTYTFKAVSTSPGGSYVGLGAFDPIEDPFLALYSNFDPTNPDSGVVGCNDDLNDVGVSNDAEYRADGSIIEGHVPYLWTGLTPGQYTLVLFTWEDLSSSDLDAGFAPNAGLDFVVGTKTTTFELWGPVGGLSLGHIALAATGVDASYGFVGGGAAVLGALLLLVAARRRRTAG